MAPALAEGSVALATTVAWGLATTGLSLLLLLLLCSFFHRANWRFSTQKMKENPGLVRGVKLARLGSSEGGAALLGGRLATGRWLCPSATSVPAAAGAPRTLARSRTWVLGATCPPRLPLQLWGTAGWGDPPPSTPGCWPWPRERATPVERSRVPPSEGPWGSASLR
ncbi:uncharacterized protein ACIBXB_020987 [Morphnus guianensis]